jgi:hypothetical protein
MPSFSSLADLVKHYESGGDYTNVNPKSGASGAYQFVPSTWRTYALQAGVDVSQYPSAASAPPAVQDSVFANMVGQRGLADYTCPGCNAPLTSYVNANPSVTNLPIFAGGNGSTGSGGSTLTMAPDQSVNQDFFGGQPGVGGVVDPSSLPGDASLAGNVPSLAWTDPSQEGSGYAPFLVPGTSNPLLDTTGSGAFAPQAQSVAGTSVGDLIPPLFANLGNFFIRAALVLVGIVLIAAAAWAMSRGEFGAGPQRLARAVAA